MKRLFSHLLLPAVLFLAGSSAFAQLDTGTISGAVADITGNVVPNVKVVLRNELTGALREVVANSQGYYTFPLIPSGRYTLEIEQQGFKSYRRTGLVLQVNQNLNVAITLELGELSESVCMVSPHGRVAGIGEEDIGRLGIVGDRDGFERRAADGSRRS
jgi:Carboxypeptidase regulatory-like domain